jgi:FtsZ-binding cell division protein ZapB
MDNFSKLTEKVQEAQTTLRSLQAERELAERIEARHQEPAQVRHAGRKQAGAEARLSIWKFANVEIWKFKISTFPDFQIYWFA